MNLGCNEIWFEMLVVEVGFSDCTAVREYHLFKLPDIAVSSALPRNEPES